MAIEVKVRTSVPITIQALQLCVPVTLGGRQQMAQLDTGSPDIHVTRRVSSGLEILKVGKTQGAFQQAETLVVKLPGLSWLGRPYRNLPAIVRPDRKEKAPFPVEITLGNVLLLERPLHLDLRMMAARSVAPRGYIPVTKIPLHLRQGISFLEMTLGGRRVHTIFDTGAGYSALNARRTDLQGSEVLSFEVFDATGASRWLKLYRGPSLSLGGHDLGPPEYTMIDLLDQEALLGSPIDFILGVNTMLRAGGIWEFDTKTGQISWG